MLPPLAAHPQECRVGKVQTWRSATHARTFTHIQHTHAHTYTYTLAHTHMRTQHTHARTHIHTLARTHTHTHTRMHAHTHNTRTEPHLPAVQLGQLGQPVLYGPWPASMLASTRSARLRVGGRSGGKGACMLSSVGCRAGQQRAAQCVALGDALTRTHMRTSDTRVRVRVRGSVSVRVNLGLGAHAHPHVHSCAPQTPVV